MADEVSASSNRNTARMSLKVGSFQADMEVDVTPRGLVAIGFLVSSILLAVTPIILASTRKLPDE